MVGGGEYRLVFCLLFCQKKLDTRPPFFCVYFSVCACVSTISFSARRRAYTQTPPPPISISCKLVSCAGHHGHIDQKRMRQTTRCAEVQRIRKKKLKISSLETMKKHFFFSIAVFSRVIFFFLGMGRRRPGQTPLGLAPPPPPETLQKASKISHIAHAHG